jgi:NitT/TauT family transport system permease protein
MKTAERRARGLAGQALVFLAFFVAWEVTVHVFGFKEVILPTPTTTFKTMWAKRDYLLLHTWPTVMAIVVGFGIAAISGFVIAVGIAYSRWINELTYPFLVSAQVVPKIALAPLFLIWFGVGLLPKVVIAALIAFFPIVINTAKGLTSVEPELVQFMRSLGASWREIFFKISLPSALPYIFAAYKISITLAVVGAVVGEFIASDVGLGYVVNYANITLETDVMFAGLVLLSAVGIVLFLAIVLLERYFLSWQSAVETPPETL